MDKLSDLILKSETTYNENLGKNYPITQPKT